jgi:hypothetical protein
MSPTTVESLDDPELPQRPRDRVLSGKAIVVAMLTMGVFAVSLLFIYFEFNSRPFRPLREAIGREFRHSRPNVEGGRPKGRGPMTLRISMSVPFDPLLDENQVNATVARVMAIAREYQDLPSYDRIEINLIQFVPQADARRKRLHWTGTEAAKLGTAN